MIRLSIGNKIKLFKSVLLSILLYGLKVFHLTKSDINKLNRIIMKDIKNYCRIIKSINNNVLNLELNIMNIEYYIIKRIINLKNKIIRLNENLLDMVDDIK